MRARGLTVWTLPSARTHYDAAQLSAFFIAENIFLLAISKEFEPKSPKT